MKKCYECNSVASKEWHDYYVIDSDPMCGEYGDEINYTVDICDNCWQTAEELS